MAMAMTLLRCCGAVAVLLCYGCCAALQKGKDAKGIESYFDAKRQGKLERLVSQSVGAYLHCP
jgi:hypothetical protein